MNIKSCVEIQLQRLVSIVKYVDMRNVVDMKELGTFWIFGKLVKENVGVKQAVNTIDIERDHLIIDMAKLLLCCTSYIALYVVRMTESWKTQHFGWSASAVIENVKIISFVNQIKKDRLYNLQKPKFNSAWCFSFICERL